MKQPTKLTLIEGDFTLQEAREILLTVFRSKIEFHKLKNFSSQERFGIDDKIAVKRIPQLRKCIDKIIKTMGKAELNGEYLTIKSDVLISISTHKKANELKLTTRKPK